MRQAQLLLLAALIFLSGCQEKETDPFADIGTVMPGAGEKVYRISSQGVVMLGITSHPLDDDGPLSAIHRAVKLASSEAPCSAAVYDYSDRVNAAAWLASECNRRIRAGRVTRVVLVGHSIGATAAGEIARQLVEKKNSVQVFLLVTVDAIKSGAISSTTGITSTILTLNNPIPGMKSYFTSYDGTPPVDGVRLVSHVNYYQGNTTIYHGCPMAGASENHLVTTVPVDAVNHGNVDDYAYPMILGDLRVAVRKGMLQ
nr:hypothetical protein [Planctomycetota bacterium]